jgi:hypothetical protein
VPTCSSYPLVGHPLLEYHRTENAGQVPSLARKSLKAEGRGALRIFNFKSSTSSLLHPLHSYSEHIYRSFEIGSIIHAIPCVFQPLYLLPLRSLPLPISQTPCSSAMEACPLAQKESTRHIIRNSILPALYLCFNLLLAVYRISSRTFNITERQGT